MRKPSKRYAKCVKVRNETGYRSGLEVLVANRLVENACRFGYESRRLPYIVPEKQHHYTPDFFLPVPCIVVEVKGELTSADRAKMKLVKAQYPDLDIRFVFSNPFRLIRKGSQTTYAMWCDNHGFPFAKQFVPQGWITHTPSPAQRRAFDAVISNGVHQTRND